MKTIHPKGLFSKIMTAVGIYFLTVFAVQAQDTAYEPVYLLREYMKVQPGMEADYLKLEQTWKKVHLQRKADGGILDWGLYRRVFPSGTNVEYDYMTITIFKNGKKFEESGAIPWDYIVKLMDQQDMTVMENTDNYRKLVSRSIDVLLERVQRNGPNIQVIDVQALPGQGAELVRIEKMMNPVFVEACKSGAIASWGFGQYMFPMSQEQGGYYRYISTNSLDGMFKLSSSGYLEKAFKKVYPSKNFDATMKSISNIVTIKKTELWKEMDSTF